MNRTLLLLGAVAIALGDSTAAHADDLALSFEMAVVQPSSVEPSASATPTAMLEPPLDVPLQVPANATEPPMQEASRANPELPPPPPTGGFEAIAQPFPQPFSQPFLRPANPRPSAAPALVATSQPASPEESLTLPIAPSGSKSVELRFDVPAGHLAQQKAEEPQPFPVNQAVNQAINGAARLLGLAPPVPKPANGELEALFHGGADSLVARVVGSAEGTRAADGQRTKAYYGHTDPGNGMWNLGSFSYQHGASSPEEADERQLRRLQKQADLLQRKAASHGISLTLEELLNGIDLANQAPMAALDRGGYIDWLAEARRRGMQGESAILWARTRAFIDPDTQQWNAPGLGNTADSISRDQDRRMRAIARAHEHYRTQTSQPVALNPPTPPPAAPATNSSVGGDLPSPPSPSLGQAPPTEKSPETSTEKSGVLDSLFSINLPEFAF
ncbi:hypothetical protein [Thermoleptolyngbya oregonensis]|uniref:hypothetical protein n=1 Tax=Thermoleptolyngbya oregonensis TaxID=2303529 RepID=UPI002931E86A|nr:hypothetical protein [Thermoleptolyngbya oregonensis]